MQPKDYTLFCIETHEGPLGPDWQFIDVSLQISLMSSANITASHERPLKQSFMYIKMRTGPSTEPCGTPPITSINLEYPSPTFTRSVLLVRKLCIQLWSLPAIPSWSNFCSNLRWETQSKAFLKSKYILRLLIFCLKLESTAHGNLEGSLGLIYRAWSHFASCS